MKPSLLFLVLIISINGENLSGVEDFKKSNILFTSDLYKELVQKSPENFVVCPFSIETVLALVHAGAAEITARELANGLHLPDDSPKIQEIFKALTLEAKSTYTLNSVNKLYLANRFSVNNNYRNIATNIFKAQIENIEFTDKKKAAAIMNRWVEEQTENKIKNLISDDYLNPNTVSVLINAIYFNANWLYPFESSFTQPQTFHIDKQREVKVDMMYSIIYTNIHNNDELSAQFLELPYEGEDVFMTIVLPYKLEGMSVLESKIEKVLQRQPISDESEVTVFIPRFKMETTISLEPILRNLRIREAFTAAANFSRMTVNDHRIFLSHVEQKAFIEVTEKGTTAGAATFAISEDRSFGARFIANHPFIFILRHRVNGILFVGKVVNPRGAH